MEVRYWISEIYDLSALWFGGGVSYGSWFHVGYWPYWPIAPRRNEGVEGVESWWYDVPVCGGVYWFAIIQVTLTRCMQISNYYFVWFLPWNTDLVKTMVYIYVSMFYQITYCSIVGREAGLWPQRCSYRVRYLWNLGRESGLAKQQQLLELLCDIYNCRHGARDK